MCGIVGYVGARPVREQLLAGLEKLEYRGYDSAGISVLNGDAVESVRAVGNLQALRAAIAARAGGDDVSEEQPQTAVALRVSRSCRSSWSRPTAAERREGQRFQACPEEPR